MKRISLAFLLMLFQGVLFAQLTFSDQLHVRAAKQLNDRFGEEIWEGIAKVPFSLLLVTDSGEFLMFHENPSEEFVEVDHEKMITGKVWYRPSVFRNNLLATFPAVGGQSCIVVGTPKNTGLNSNRWVTTLLHEHFHQMQQGDSTYYADVANLDLDGGDDTGMWMLNYPFPYDDSAVNAKFDAFKLSLLNLLESKGLDLTEDYLAARKAFEQGLSEKDYAYFSFQVWQEGIARYTEYQFLESVKQFIEGLGVTSLSSFDDYLQIRELLYAKMLENLKSQSLLEDQRLCFYTIGFAEGLVLDRLNPDWKELYLKEKFFIEKYLDANVK
ncbi:MAG: hypothetical protein JXQ90_10755 [Cyclobacteriaceae bacterium]